MSTKNNRNTKKAKQQNAKRSLQAVVGPPRRSEKDPYKEAWMAGARAGTEVAFDLIMRSLENMGRTLGIKKRKQPNVGFSDAARKDSDAK